MAIQPHHALVDQLAQARRLGKWLDERPFVRQLENGEVEVAGLRRGVLYRWRVAPDGTYARVSQSPRTTRYMVGVAMTFAGTTALVVAMTCLAVFHSDGEGGGLWVSLFVIGTVTAGLGAFTYSSADERARKPYAEDLEWLPLVSVIQKKPVGTVAQLLAAERLAASHENTAVVQALDDGAIEVVTESKGSLDDHVVDAAGNVTLVHTAPRTTRYELGLAVGFLGLGLFFVGLVGAIVWHPWAGFLCFAGVFVTILSKLIDGDLRSRAQRRYGGTKASWVEIDRREGGD